MIQVSMNERKDEILRNIRLDGFTVNTRLTSADFATYCNNQDVDFAKTLLKVILKRDNQQFVIIQDDLKCLGLSCNLFTMSRRSFYQDHPHQITMVGFTASIHGETLLSFDIDLGGVLDIKGDDQLVVELSANTGFMGTDVLPNASYIELKARKTIAFEKYVPITRSYPIQAGERRKTYDLGNSVMDITLLNYTYNTHAVPAVQSITLATAKMDETYTFYDLLGSRLSSRPDQGVETAGTISAVDEYDQCFKIISDTELDRVNVDIQFNPANIVANDNILVVRSAYTDVKTLIEHEANVINAQNAKISELKQNGANAVVTPVTVA